MKSLHAAMNSSYHLPQLEKAHVQQWRPSAAKILKKNFSEFQKKKKLKTTTNKQNQKSNTTSQIETKTLNYFKHSSPLTQGL